MIFTYGGQEFIIDEDFIILRSCYVRGNNCNCCSEFLECMDDLEYAYDRYIEMIGEE